MDHNTNQWLKILLPVAGIMLLAGILPVFPYAYYQVLRWITTGTAIVLVCKYLNTKHKFLVVINAIIAIVFNPIAPIFLNRGVWAVFDFAVAIFFLILKKETYER